VDRRPHTAHHALDGALRILGADLLIVPTGLLIAAFLTRKLGPAGFGEFALAVTLVTAIEWAIVSMFSRAALKLTAEADDWHPVGAAIVRAHLIAGGIAALLTLSVAVPLSRWLGSPGMLAPLLILALDIPIFSLAAAHRNILAGLGQYRERALGTSARWIARLILVLILVGLGFSVAGAAAANVGASLIELVVARLYIRPSMRHREPVAMQQLLVLAGPLFVFSLCLRAFDKMDLFALRALGGSLADAGTYSAAQSLAIAPGILAGAIATVLVTTLSRRLQEGDTEGARRIARGALRLAMLLIPFVAVAAGAARGLMTVIFGDAFIGGATPLGFLMLSAVAIVLLLMISSILLVEGRAAWMLGLVGPMLPLAIVGYLVAIPRYGAVGASAVTAAVAMTAAGAGLVVVKRVSGVDIPVPSLLRATVVGIVAFAVASSFSAQRLMLIIELAMLCVAVAACLAVLGEFTGEERRLVMSALRTKRLLAHQSP
jgi:O-antigen/teichoic acid export membrane protein